MTYSGNSGKQYTAVEPFLGKGGEGCVYQIMGLPDFVLKIFSAGKRTETRHRKLLAMIKTPLPQSAMQQVTWPVDVVYENGRFAGYVMPLIKNNENLNVMYSDKYSCTLYEKIAIAKNLCAALNAVHSAGQVCGDLNPLNIAVDPRSAIVTLVDTDSYHITEQDHTRVYRCEVGLPEYLPREIQEKMRGGTNLATAPLPTFTKYTDLFALAVHIFALLMNGCHPFACATDARLASAQPSVVNPQPIENICSGFFPFYHKRPGIATPKYAPDFAFLPQELQQLFIRAFVNGHTNPAERPDTVTWYNALADAQKNLTVCSQNRQHMYPAHLRACPWCQLETNLRSAPARISQTSVHTRQQYNPPQQRSAPPAPHPVPKRKKKLPWTVKLLLGIMAIVLLFAVVHSYSSGYSSQPDSQLDYNNAQTDTEQNSDYNDPDDTIISEPDGSGEDADIEPEPEPEPVVELRTLDITELEREHLAIDGIYSAEPLVIAEEPAAAVSGYTSETEDVQAYSYIAPRDGIYQFDLIDVQADASMRILVMNSNGEEILDSYKGAYAYLNEQETYEIQVRHFRGESEYVLQIGVPKPTTDISSATEINDQITFENQRNVYTFTAPKSGNYRFDLTEVNANTKFRMLLWDRLDNKILDEYSGGATAALAAGETYRFEVRQYSGTGSYKMLIGFQKAEWDITGYGSVNDSIQYTDQKNLYTFVPPITGRYRFELTEANANTKFRMLLWDPLDNVLIDDYSGGAYAFLEAGEVYALQVRQYSGFSSYTMTVGYQKETVDLSNTDVVYDSITFADQKNVYTYTPLESGTYTFTLGDTNASCRMRLLAWDKLENNIMDSYNGQGSAFLEAGETYQVQVRQHDGLSSYSLTIEAE